MSSKNLFTNIGEAIDRYRTESVEGNNAIAVKKNRASAALRWFLPNGGTILIVLLLLLTQQVWANNAQSNGGNNPSSTATTINYQGFLASSDGTPQNGTFGMSFALYDALSGGSIVWGPENHNAVSITDGLFNVGLGSLTGGGIPANVWNGNRYLQITVSGEALTPRELIRSVPISGMALTVPDGAISSRKSSLTMNRVGASGSYYDLTSETPILIPGTSSTLSLPVPSKVLVVATCDSEARNANSLVICDLWVNGTPQGISMHAGRATNTQGAASRITASNSYVLDLGAGSHNIQIRARLWRADSNQIGRVYAGHTGYSYIVTSQ